MSDLIKIKSRIKKNGHNRALVGIEVVDAPPHVKAHIFDRDTYISMPEAGEIVLELMRLGYVIEIEESIEEVGLWDIAGEMDNGRYKVVNDYD